MTQILQIITDFISANLPDQRHLRSINSKFKKPTLIKNRTLMTQILQMFADLISANPSDQRHLRSIN